MNPFKVGDHVCERGAVLLPPPGSPGYISVVTAVQGERVNITGDSDWWHYTHLRAAVRGVDYDRPVANSGTYQGHLPDGSSVQKHSAGPLYPCVLVYRDKVLTGPGKYDVGVISPRNQEPLWCTCLDAAVAVAEAIKKDLP